MEQKKSKSGVEKENAISESYDRVDCPRDCSGESTKGDVDSLVKFLLSLKNGDDGEKPSESTMEGLENCWASLIQRSGGKDGDHRKLLTKIMKIFTRMFQKNFERLFSRLGNVEQALERVQKAQVQISENDAERMVQLWDQLKVFWEERLKDMEMRPKDDHSRGRTDADQVRSGDISSGEKSNDDDDDDDDDWLESLCSNDATPDASVEPDEAQIPDERLQVKKTGNVFAAAANNAAANNAAANAAATGSQMTSDEGFSDDDDWFDSIQSSGLSEAAPAKDVAPSNGATDTFRLPAPIVRAPETNLSAMNHLRRQASSTAGFSVSSSSAFPRDGSIASTSRTLSSQQSPQQQQQSRQQSQQQQQQSRQHSLQQQQQSRQQSPQPSKERPSCSTPQAKKKRISFDSRVRDKDITIQRNVTSYMDPNASIITSSIPMHRSSMDKPKIRTAMATLPRNHFPSNASNVGGRSFRSPSPHCGLEQQRIKAAPVREEGPSLREEAEEPDYDQKPLVKLDSSGMGHRSASASSGIGLDRSRDSFSTGTDRFINELAPLSPIPSVDPRSVGHLRYRDSRRDSSQLDESNTSFSSRCLPSTGQRFFSQSAIASRNLCLKRSPFFEQ